MNDPATIILATGVSFADGTPIALFTSCFPGWLPDRFEADLKTTESVTQALALSGITDWTRTSTHISARNASSVQAGQLRVKEGAALILSESVNRSADGRAVEIGQTWFAGDRVTLHMQGGDSAASHG
jgi:GntR family phosphonate transport system transcriptional regulator